ncbi:hypothetical protein BIZ78_gp016 [Erwinia phage vB_EamM_Caitlin]|uniref:hypothetical protein n=1 Tax=Erwinia phage vB_EamM_Caitlin TaxID=1883379 RepID=UPI00081D21E8|nr:hypothetical protein BIZ78_gp016 [Erwinia phage vB_EamM_Caitlin]ANZ48559.1 hypothetical protein CAITLIN_264 [Erwinia phage vB_EamM_Caitlin]
MSSDPFTPKLALTCNLHRDEIITRISLLAETHLLALKQAVADEIFDAVAAYPVELINNSINGYQRFLSDLTSNGGDSAAIVAGMILRFKAALTYEFGTPIVDALKDEVFVNMTDEQYTSAFGKKDGVSLWGVANPTLESTPINTAYDLIATYLFINHAKWLVVRAGAAMQDEKTEKN